MAPHLPDLAAWLVDQITPDLPDATVGVRRPPTDENREGQFVRVVVLGGPLRWGCIWSPTVALECWADTRDEAFDLCSDATDALCDLEGFVTPGFLHLSEVDVMTACSDAPIDGHPVVVTTALVAVEVPIIIQGEDHP